MKKGFTLIELLAVIVILAIIALIATPIILGIINDAKEDSNKRSIENYAHAVELAVARAATKQGGVINEGTYTIDPDNKQIIYDNDNSIKISVDYKGEKITGKVEVDAKGKIKLSEISLNGSETLYTYTEQDGVQQEKGKEITEEKDISMAFYQYNTMYHETQSGLVEGNLISDSNNDKKLDINSELSAFLNNPIFNIPTTEFTEAVPSSGNISAIITHYDGTEEEIILTTTDNNKWTYKYTYEDAGEIGEAEFEFRPYTKLEGNYWYESNYSQSTDYHFLNLDCSDWVPFAKITLLGKTIEFPVHKKVAVLIGDINGEMETMFADINKVSKVIVNFKNGVKKEYSRNQMHDADKYFAENHDYCPSPSIPVLYYYNSDLDVYALVIYIPYPEIKDSLDSVIVEENGILTKYNITDNTYVMHGVTGS